MAALTALYTAFLIDLLLGDPPNRFHPVGVMGKFIHGLADRWNHGSRRRRFLSGLGLVLLGGVVFGLPWLLAGALRPAWPDWALGVLMGVCLKPVFAVRGLLKAGWEVQQALLAGQLPEARRRVAWHLVSRDTSELSDRQVASATIESLAENLTDSFLAPLFYFALGGLPLPWCYRFANTAAAMIGYHSERYEYFGKFAARLDDVLNWLPARIAAVLLVFSAGVCRMDAGQAWRVMSRQHGRTSSPNAGWTMAAAAGALGVVLEKQGNYRLEGGRQLPAAGDIGRALRLTAVSLLVSLLFCGGLVLALQWLG
jgi:adenosylcobinamide-phosphate synthase